MENELEVMRRELVHEMAPSDTPAVSKATRFQMWRLHTNDQTRFSVSNLARRVGVSAERARALLVLEGMAQHARERGEFVGSGAEVDKAIRAAGFEVRDMNIEPPRDRSIAQVPHRISEAFLKGEVDEIQVQRVVAGRTTAQKYAAQRAKLFPPLPPADVPRDAVESRPLAPATRRTMRGRRLFVIDADLSQLAAEPALRHTIPITVHERDGSVRTASWHDRRTVFQAGERRPRGNELEPIEQIRRLVNTPPNFRREKFQKKQYLEYEASLKPLDPALALRLDAEDAAAAGPGIVDRLLAPNAEADNYVAEEEYDYDNVRERFEDVAIDKGLGKVVRVDKNKINKNNNNKSIL